MDVRMPQGSQSFCIEILDWANQPLYGDGTLRICSIPSLTNESEGTESSSNLRHELNRCLAEMVFGCNMIIKPLVPTFLPQLLSRLDAVHRSCLGHYQDPVRHPPAKTIDDVSN